jgi:hypothetical protein
MELGSRTVSIRSETAAQVDALDRKPNRGGACFHQRQSRHVLQAGGAIDPFEDAPSTPTFKR